LSKKKFTTGLESLFGDSSEKAFQEESPFLDVAEEETPSKKRERKESTRSSRSSRSSGAATAVAKRSNKNFTSDLESLFEQAMSETIEEKMEQANQKEEVKRKARKRRKPLSGLDALIRRTDGLDYVEVNVPNKKRVTFVFDKEKLAQLKSIAKSKKIYLKDIIGDVMSSFIEKYENGEMGEIA